MKLKLLSKTPVSWLHQYDPEPTLLPRSGSSVMVPVCVLATKDSLESFVLTEESDLNEVSEAIISRDRDVLFFIVPRTAVMEVCPELGKGDS